MANPFDPDYVAPPPAYPGSLTPGILQALAGTKPWVRFCSVMGFICTGFMVLFSGLMLVSSLLVGTMAPKGSVGLGGINAGIGVIYLLLAVLYLFPSIKLWKFGTSILSLMMSNSVADLDQAMEQQRGFWKFVAIMMIIGFSLSLLATGAMAMLGPAATAR